MTANDRVKIKHPKTERVRSIDPAFLDHLLQSGWTQVETEDPDARAAEEPKKSGTAPRTRKDES